MQSTKRTRGNLRPFFLRSRLVDNRGRSRQGPPDPGRGNTPRNVRRTYPGQTRTNTPGPGAGTQSAGSRHTPTPGHVRRDRKGRTGTATGRTRTHQERVCRTNPGKRTPNPRRASTGRFRPFPVDPGRARGPFDRSDTRPDPVGRTKPGRYALCTLAPFPPTPGHNRDAYGPF